MGVVEAGNWGNRDILCRIYRRIEVKIRRRRGEGEGIEGGYGNNCNGSNGNGGGNGSGGGNGNERVMMDHTRNLTAGDHYIAEIYHESRGPSLASMCSEDPMIRKKTDIDVTYLTHSNNNNNNNAVE